MAWYSRRTRFWTLCERSCRCTYSMKECKNGYSNSQRKDIYIEHRAGKAPCQASWRKMTQLGELLVMVHWYKMRCLIPLHRPDDARWTPPWRGKRCWYGGRVVTSLIPDFYDTVEISGGVPIPQIWTFPKTKACAHCGDRTFYLLYISFLLLYLYTTAALVIHMKKITIIRNRKVW